MFKEPTKDNECSGHHLISMSVGFCLDVLWATTTSALGNRMWTYGIKGLTDRLNRMTNKWKMGVNFQQL